MLFPMRRFASAALALCGACVAATAVADGKAFTMPEKAKV